MIAGTKRKQLLVFVGGIAIGILLTLGAILLWNTVRPDSAASMEIQQTIMVSSAAEIASSGTENSSNLEPSRPDSLIPAGAEAEASSAPPGKWAEWGAGTVYQGGDTVLHNGKIYRAKWWTQGEEPGRADVWEDTKEAPQPVSSNPSDNSSGAEPPISAAKREGFRVVGYFPSWKPEQLSKVRYDVLTHMVYAFAIPTSDGGLLPLENEDAARELIAEAHKNGVQVLLAVGGWSYNDVPLEPVFVSATASGERAKAFGDAILTMCQTYGFDGVDIDWEHPRVDGGSAKQYEDLMLYLAAALHGEGKVLTSAVLSGATADGNIYYDAAAHSDAVLGAVDWIHVMAYDGGDGERHSPYEFAVNSANYWLITRKLPAAKVVLGVPFYARPSWASYGDILSADPDAWKKDVSSYNGMEAWYNGVDTIQRKTRFAMQKLGGVMIWEVTQDTADREKSLVTAIGEELGKATGKSE